MAEKLHLILVLCFIFKLSAAAGGIKFAPYVDVSKKEGPKLIDVYRQTGVKTFTLAFVLSASGQCQPSWTEVPFNDPDVKAQIDSIKEIGGEFVLASGGALGPYLESACSSPQQLLNVYKTALDYVGTNHLDIDVETTIPLDTMNAALAQLQRERPQVSIGFTLMVTADDYGIIDSLGVQVLENAVKHGVRVDVVNPMAMEFWSLKDNWVEAVIGSAQSTVVQMKRIWPQKSESDLYHMLGVTPMIGRNFNGRIFDLSHASRLVDWANSHNIAFLSFWSVGRDNGGCSSGVSAFCSGISQSQYEFTKIFSRFSPNHQWIPVEEVPTQPSTTNVEPWTAAPDKTSNLMVDCSKPGEENNYFTDPKDCSAYYRCVNGKAQSERCLQGTIWDGVNEVCNWPELVNRPEC